MTDTSASRPCDHCRMEEDAAAFRRIAAWVEAHGQVTLTAQEDRVFVGVSGTGGSFGASVLDAVVAEVKRREGRR